MMDFEKLMQETLKMKNELMNGENRVNSTIYEGTASNGLVKISCNGNFEITNVEIDESILNKEDKEMIQDLIMIATNEVLDKVNKAKDDNVRSAMASIGIK